MKMKLVVVLAASIALANMHPVRGDEAAASLKTKLVTLSLFKNGLGFVTREGELPKGDVSVLIEDLPAPAHGTFWAYSPGNEATIRDLVAFQRDAIQRVEAISVAELLQANVGQTVDIRLGDKETIRGKLLSVATNRISESVAPAGPRYESSSYVPPAEMASLVVIQTANGTTALNKGAVQQFTVVEGPLKTTIEQRTRGAALRLHAANAGGRGRIVVQYLAKGITWAPSCAIDITDPKTARLTTKAEILNEIEDLDNVAVNLITGFPNLQFADVTDPMAMRGDLAAFLNSLLNPPPPGQSSGRRGVVAQQAVLSNATFGGADTFPAYSNIPQEGQTREELFFYEHKGVSLKKGERGYYPLYTVDAPYDQVYEWKVGDVLDEQERYRDQRAPEKAEEVWHSVRLTNSGNIPWTTAPATTMQGGQVLGQDVMYYTSAGAKTTVKVTQAVDIKPEQAEFEVERKRNAANFYGSSFDLVVVRGTLKATNFKSKDITLTITKDLSGEVVKTTPEAKMEQTAKGLKRVNPRCVLTWELPIKARDKIDIEYEYRVYVRN